jgi:uncharacterized membrane protein YjjB (DUF3815 family)
MPEQLLHGADVVAAFEQVRRKRVPQRVAALLLGAWVIALFAPAFCAGFVARRRGWLYGVVLGGLPIAIALVAKYEIPVVLVVAFWVVAITGGALGHLASRTRHAL